jgi:hypothetical protein
LLIYIGFSRNLQINFSTAQGGEELLELMVLLDESPSAGLNVYLDNCQAIQGPDFASLWLLDANLGIINAGEALLLAVEIIGGNECGSVVEIDGRSKGGLAATLGVNQAGEGPTGYCGVE